MVRPSLAELSATIFVTSSIYCKVWEIRDGWSAQSRSSKCFQSVHWITLLFRAIEVIITQYMASKNRKGVSKQSCLTSVCTSNVSVSCLT
ncbi:hypothetical protein DPMN_096059 [Dreissena polymorpha]|uniref:Uncharacterized protein n=1 Tax=Dreissena polymorpha TaxID=45954 RepID=A0A9D4L915_DREPO|nr:hypothetical protein DPMN_096059 [Dreissena polymorpha]